MDTSPHRDQDIDAGIDEHSPAPDEPHRAHDAADRGGAYAREQAPTKPIPQPIGREDAERALPAHSDLDDPAQ